MSGLGGSDERDRGLRAVRRVREVRERDGRLGLRIAMAEEQEHTERLVALQRRRGEASPPGTTATAAFLASRQSMLALSAAVAEAEAELAPARRITVAARERWQQDSAALATVDSLLDRRAAKRRRGGRPGRGAPDGRDRHAAVAARKERDVTVTDVASRIAQIQGALGLLAPPASQGGDAFAASLKEAAGAQRTGDARGIGGGTRVSGAEGVRGGGEGGGGGGSLAAGREIVAEAKKHLGIPYVWGGTDLSQGVDCSGLVQSVYAKFGYDLPRVSSDQARAGRPVASMAQAQPGDLIAWDNSSRNNGADHIAIYAGNGKMIEAPRTGLNVRLIDVPTTPDMIRRIVPESAPAAPARAEAAGGGGQVGAGTPFANLFNKASAKYGVDGPLLAAIAKQESAYDPRAVSHAGAQGLMQLMPATARGLGVRDSFDPAQAVDGAARLMRDLLDRFDSTRLALAAYNAGPGAVLRYDGIPPYQETQHYVKTIMADLNGRR